MPLPLTQFLDTILLVLHSSRSRLRRERRPYIVAVYLSWLAVLPVVVDCSPLGSVLTSVSDW